MGTCGERCKFNLPKITWGYFFKTCFSMKKRIFLFALIGQTLPLFAQNVGIGTNAPNASAKLEISDANRGLLIPRIALTATNAATPVASPATSLLVYNTATAGTGTTAVTPGYYYWNGSAWVRLAVGTAGWELLGNTGTSPATNFIGTVDAVDFITRTSNVERIRVTAGGDVGVGTNSPVAKLHVGNGNARIGEINPLNTGTFPSYGRYLFFSGGSAGSAWDSDNSDALWIARYNLSPDYSELRVNIGDNTAAGADRFIVGYSNPTFGEVFSASANGAVTANSLAGTGTRLVTSNASGVLGNVAAGTNGQVLTMVSGAPAWTNNTDWTTAGNAGTTASANFIGTTDAIDFVTRTNNTERMRVSSDGRVSVGSSQANGMLTVFDRWDGTITGLTYNGRLPGMLAWDNSDFVGLTTADRDNSLATGDDADAVLYWGDNATDKLLFSFLRWGGSALIREDKATMLADGSFGVGTLTPTVRIDARASSGDGAIGVGSSAQTAAAAGAGAVRYSSASGGQIQYSNGSAWTTLAASPIKAIVVGKNSVTAGSFPNNTSTTLNTWTELQDATASFNPTTGIFTAPRTGVYIASATINFASGTIAGGSQVEIIWLSSSGQQIKCAHAFPAGGTSQAGCACSASMYLTAGETLRADVWHSLGATKVLRVGTGGDDGFNNITITEQ